MPFAALLGLTLVIQVLFMMLCLSIVVGLGTEPMPNELKACDCQAILRQLLAENRAKIE